MWRRGNGTSQSSTRLRSSQASRPDQFLDPIEFGRILIESEDLDPIYVMLWRAKLPRSQLRKWLIAYWCFYHAGTASVLSETPCKDFFRTMRGMVPGTTWPRGTERRHFRGENGIKSVAFLHKHYGTPTNLFHYLIVGEPLSLSESMERVERWRGFGPWISFKVADMLERLDLCRIEFRPEDVFSMFESPRKGAKDVAGRLGGPEGDRAFLWAYEALTEELGELRAPPRYERRINIQEVETILCKYHSYLGGHYPPGKDLREIREGLLRYAKCKTVQRLLKELPKEIA